MGLKWTDIEGIAIALYEAHPDVDPMKVHFMDLREWIAGLQDWDDDIHRTNEAKLEAIQMAWLEEIRGDR